MSSSLFVEPFPLHAMKMNQAEKQDPLLRVNEHEVFELAASSKLTNKQGEICRLDYQWRTPSVYGSMEDREDDEEEEGGREEGVPAVMPSKRPREEEERAKKPKTIHSLPLLIPQQPINVLICKVYMSGYRNTWRRISIPTSVYCQAIVDTLAASFNMKAPSLFIAKFHFSDKYAFKGGPRPENTQHAMLTRVSELNLEAGDGFDIIYSTNKQTLVVECIRRENGTQRSVQVLKGVNDDGDINMDAGW